MRKELVRATVRCWIGLCSLTVSTGCLPSIKAQTPTPTTSEAANPVPYPDTADGLIHLLDDMRAAAKSDDTVRLGRMIQGTEIPDYENWLVRTFGKEKGKSWSAPYGARLEQQESAFEARMRGLSQREGVFSAKEIVATDIYDTLQTPLDLFLASWSPPNVGDLPHRPIPIAYFFFINGKFRWNSTVTFVEVPVAKGPPHQENPPAADDPNLNYSDIPRAGTNGVGQPTCEYCPAGSFPQGVKRTGNQVTVSLKAIVTTSGRTINIQIVRSGGPAFDESAVAAMKTWRLKPAKDRNGQVISTWEVFEVIFH
ncbi:MAG TPA: energy transducer TonB [Candidatus Acidoferrales bacterium]|nr:energy transducer TonB [Candidatus Acidoferrales bacterium]